MMENTQLSNSSEMGGGAVSYHFYFIKSAEMSFQNGKAGPQDPDYKTLNSLEMNANPSASGSEQPAMPQYAPDVDVKKMHWLSK